MFDSSGERISNLGNHLSNDGEAYIVQGTQTYGNLEIIEGEMIPPGGPELNGSEQDEWLSENTDVRLANAGEAANLWPMYPTGEEFGQGGEIRHPGVRFDILPATCDNNHADALGRQCLNQ